MATTSIAVGTMRVAQITKAGGGFEIVEREIPNPCVGQVRIMVQACGICHSDVLVKEGLWPGLQYPRVPGHEIAGRVDALGDNVAGWKVGQRVGVGWHGGHDFSCDECRRECKGRRRASFVRLRVLRHPARAFMPSCEPGDQLEPEAWSGLRDSTRWR